MKKIAKITLIAILIFSLILSTFVGCDNSSADLAKKYGISMTDKSVTYDGESHDMDISVDNSLLQGKNYTVTYAQGDKALAVPSFETVGSHAVTATVSIDGEEPFTLTSTLTIKAVDLVLEIGNIFLRQGQGISSLGNPRDLFKDAEFVGDDTVASLGTLKFEVYDGSSKASDLSKLKPTTSVSKGYKVKIVSDKASTNYNVTFKEGELFVMSGGDYDVAKDLKSQIDTVPTESSINEFDYSQMRSFVSSANDIISDYPKTTDIQRLMSGTVNVDSVKTLYDTAKKRVDMVYSLEEEISGSDGSVEFWGVSHPKNEIRDEDDDDYVDDFEADGKSARENAEYGDEIAFRIHIVDTTETKFLGCYINDLFLDASVFTVYEGKVTRDQALKGLTSSTTGTGGGKSYVYGTINELKTGTDAYPDKNYGKENTGTTDGLNVSSNLLGNLDGFSSLDFVPLIGESYTVGLFSDGKDTALTHDNLELDVNSSGSITGTAGEEFDKNTGRIYGEEISSLKITSRGETVFEIKDYGTSNDDYYTGKQLVIGQTYKLILVYREGYELVEIEIGDDIVTPKDLENGVYEFTLTEDHLTGKIVRITPRFAKEYTFAVKEDTKTLRNENEAGFYEGEYVNVTLDGVEEGRVATMISGNSLGIKLDVADFYQIVGFEIKGQIWDSTEKKFIKTTDLDSSKYKRYTDVLLDDILSSHNTEITLDMGDGDFNLRGSSESPVEIVVKLKATYPITATAVYDGKTYDMSGSDGEFSSKYGEVALYNNYENASAYNTSGMMIDGARYYLAINNEDGYIPVSIKVNNNILASGAALGEMSNAVGEKNRNLLMNKGVGTSYIVGDSTTSSKIEFSRPTAFDENNTIPFGYSSLEAGDELNIEIEYISYHNLNIIPGLEDWKYYEEDVNTHNATVTGMGDTEYKIKVRGIIDGENAFRTLGENEVITLPDTAGKLIGSKNSAIIAVKNGDRYSYYVYGVSDADEISVEIIFPKGQMVSGDKPLPGQPGRWDAEIQVGNEIEIDEDGNSSLDIRTDVESVIAVPKNGTSSDLIEPGEDIDINLDCSYTAPTFD